MSPDTDLMTRRRTLSQVALGLIPPDVVVIGGALFNAFTKEFIRGQSLWIKDGMIAYAGPEHPWSEEETQVVHADGMVLLPGLIDGHTHLIHRCGIEEFVRYVIPGGTTTVITETSELGSIAGIEGIRSFLRGLARQPIRFFHTLAPLCGLTPSEEATVPKNEALLDLLKEVGCLGVGEAYWGNLFLEGNQGERIRELASLSLGLGKTVEGHGAGATGKKLQAYACFGVSSDHEPITDREVTERLRLGYWVMIREGAVRRELDGIKDVFKGETDLRRLILCTDSVDPEGFIEEGYLDGSLRRALRLGVPPGLAYQMVTINVAEHFRLDPLIGSLSPGRLADVVMIPSAGEYVPQRVMVGGRTIFKDGERTVGPEQVSFPDFMLHTVKVSDVRFPPLQMTGKKRAMELVSRLVTKETIVDMEKPGDSKDLIMVCALDRLEGRGSFLGLLKGFGLGRGAYGSTMCWDTPDMIIAGCDVLSMKTAAGRLKEIGGGGVYAVGDQVVAEFPAPLCGIASLRPMSELRERIRRLEECLREAGVKWEKPVLTVDTFGTPAIPHLRITHHGYVRLKDRAVLPLGV